MVTLVGLFLDGYGGKEKRGDTLCLNEAEEFWLFVWQVRQSNVYQLHAVSAAVSLMGEAEQ